MAQSFVLTRLPESVPLHAHRTPLFSTDYGSIGCLQAFIVPGAKAAARRI
jgi:hypothetical protein